jgi:hypothetical protein
MMGGRKTRRISVWWVEKSMNLGGFSIWRFIGFSAFKSRISRRVGIPLTKSGRQRKLGAWIFRLFGF